MRIESVYKLGSHTILIWRTLQDEHWSDGLEFIVEHGIYRAWRESKKRPVLDEPVVAARHL
jgi:hypothetical protein